MRQGLERRIREYALTVGELGSAGCQTTMVALLPLLLAEHGASNAVIGAVVAAEGLFALCLPYLAGRMSDRLPARLVRHFGRRSFFLILAAPVMALSLLLVPFVDGFWARVAAAFVFFAALQAYIVPLRALVVDSVDEERWGRVQGVLGAFHTSGLAYGLVIGGILFAIWRPLPFVIGAVLILLTTAGTIFATPEGSSERAAAGGEDAEEAEDGGSGEGAAAAGGGRAGIQEEIAFWKDLVGRPAVRWYLIANSLWDGAIDGIRPYIFLFAGAVLGIGVSEASLVLVVLFAGAGIGSIFVGRLGDRVGKGRVLFWGALLTGVALSAGVFIRTVPMAVGLLLPAGLGAAALISLPYPVFAELAPEEAVGRYTGVYGISVGVARLLSPLIIGAAIDFGGGIFPDHDGYPVMWVASGTLAMLGAWALHRAHRATEGYLFAA